MAVEIGKFNNLQVVKIADHGVYVDGGEEGTILLPNRYVPEGTEIDDWVDVFLYFDSDDLLIATTETPKAFIGTVELLKVIDTNRVGAFLDWGLPKDLLVPYSEQHHPMKEGELYMVYVFHDHTTDRILASSKLNLYFEEEATDLEPRQKVDLRVTDKTELGYKVLINDQYLGLIFHVDAFRPLALGERLPGYIKAIREDGKIDVSLRPQGFRNVIDLDVEKILTKLKNNKEGFLLLTDKSSPESIKFHLNISKKAFKKAIGNLYKQKLIILKDDRIELI